jgi:hypothetical protein
VSTDITMAKVQLYIFSPNPSATKEMICEERGVWRLSGKLEVALTNYLLEMIRLAAVAWKLGPPDACESNRNDSCWISQAQVNK